MRLAAESPAMLTVWSSLAQHAGNITQAIAIHWHCEPSLVSSLCQRRAWLLCAAVYYCPIRDRAPSHCWYAYNLFIASDMV